MPEQLWFTAKLNHLLAGPVTGLLHALHIDRQISPGSHLQRGGDAVVGVFVFSSRDIYSGALGSLRSTNQAVCGVSFEATTAWSKRQSEEIIGHGAEAFHCVPDDSGLIFILICNLIGLIPGLESPTAVRAVPLGCAICFVYYNAQGIRKKGVGRYAAHFLGPSDPSMSLFIRVPLAMLMLPIEIVSHLARVLSLTIRLWANLFAGDLVTMAFFSMISIVVPVLFLALHVGVSFLQTYIFVLLTMVYLAGAAAEEH